MATQLGIRILRADKDDFCIVVRPEGRASNVARNTLRISKDGVRWLPEHDINGGRPHSWRKFWAHSRAGHFQPAETFSVDLGASLLHGLEVVYVVGGARPPRSSQEPGAIRFRLALHAKKGVAFVGKGVETEHAKWYGWNELDDLFSASSRK